MTVGEDTTGCHLDGQSVVREYLNETLNAQCLIGPRGPEAKRNAQGAYG